MNEPTTETTPLAALARIRQMTDAWEQRLPETIRTETAVEVIRGVLATVVVPVSSPPADQTALRAELAKVTKQRDYWHHEVRCADARIHELGRQVRDLKAAAVLPTTNHDTDTSAELASLAVNAGRALQDEKRHYEIACRENTRLRAMVDEYGDGAGALTRKLKQVRDLHRETCPLVKGEVPSGFKCGMCELLDAPAAPLRRVADETAATETQTRQEVAVDTLARLMCDANVHVNNGYYPGWDDLSKTPGRGQDEVRKAARYLLKRLHIAERQPAAGARQDGAQPSPPA